MAAHSTWSPSPTLVFAVKSQQISIIQVIRSRGPIFVVSPETMAAYLTTGQDPDIDVAKSRVTSGAYLAGKKSYLGLTNFSTDVSISNVDMMVKAIEANTFISIAAFYYRDSSESMIKLIYGLKGKQTIKHLKINAGSGLQFVPEIFKLAGTLPLIGLDIGVSEYRPQLKLEDVEPLYNIKTLVVLAMKDCGLTEKDRIIFLSHMLKQVRSLKLNYGVDSDELNHLTELMLGDIPLQILLVKSCTDVATLGRLLEANTGLRSLTVKDAYYADYTSIFEGLTHNTQLLKLDIYCDNDELPSLIKMLQTNKTLEVLVLHLGINIDDNKQDDLIMALAHSSIVELDLYITLLDPSRFATSLLKALSTNTILKSLTLSREDDFDVLKIDTDVMVKLLTNNKTLEVLNIYNMEIDTSGVLTALTYNQSLIQFNDHAEPILKELAQRNRENKARRESTLLGLTFDH